MNGSLFGHPLLREPPGDAERGISRKGSPGFRVAIPGGVEPAGTRAQVPVKDTLPEGRVAAFVE
jgi:hypothetical protein